MFIPVSYMYPQDCVKVARVTKSYALELLWTDMRLGSLRKPIGAAPQGRESQEDKTTHKSDVGPLALAETIRRA